MPPAVHAHALTDYLESEVFALPIF